MPNLLKFLRSMTVGQTPPSGVVGDYGRMALNVQDGVLYAYDSSGTPRVIARDVKDYDPTRGYKIGQLAVQALVLYRANANMNAVAFNPTQWDAVGDQTPLMLYRLPTTLAQSTMTMGGTTISARIRAAAGQAVALAQWLNSAGDVVADIAADGYPGETFGRTVFRVDQVAHSFTAAGQPARFDGTNWVLANPATAAGMTTAVVKRIISANAFELQTAGRIDNLAVGAFETGVYVANTRYYASVSTPGKLTAIAPGSSAQENWVLFTTVSNAGIIGIQRPVGVPPVGAPVTSITVTAGSNPFTAVGMQAAFDGTNWVLADPSSATKQPLGTISSTAGLTFTIVFSGLVSNVVSGAAVTFPLTPGAFYYSNAAGLLTTTVPPTAPFGAVPTFFATAVDAGIVLSERPPSKVAGLATDLAIADGGTAASDIRTAVSNLALATADVFAAHGGTADAITLTTGRSLTALVVGMKFRSRAVTTNTLAVTVNVDGIGAMPTVTIRGVALPANFIRTDVDMEYIWNGTSFVVRRPVENGGGLSGWWERTEGGVLICRHTLTFANINTAAGTLFVSPSLSWTFPGTYLVGDRPSVTGIAATLARAFLAKGTSTFNSVQVDLCLLRDTSTASTVDAEVEATGRWY